MLWLAWKTFFHEKGRLFLTLLGITVSSVLALVEVSIYLGMMDNATSIIRRTPGDLWVTSRNISAFDFAPPFPELRINTVNSHPEVVWAEKLQLTYAYLKLANGGLEQVEVIGFNPDSPVGAPWNMQYGQATDVKGGRYMIMDLSSQQRLGKLEPHSLWEVSINHLSLFKLVGLSEGIKSFTTIPFVFMSYNEAQNLQAGGAKAGHTAFIVAKVRDPARAREVAAELKQRLSNNDVLTKQEFIDRTIHYWTIQTGMGMAFFLTALLAVLIGGAVVGQAIFANTMEHLREYGTLKAMGARNRDIYVVILGQAATSAVLGYIPGLAVTMLMQGTVSKLGVPLLLDWPLLASMFVVILITCLISAWFSVRKIRVLDPVSVFRS